MLSLYSINFRAKVHLFYDMCKHFVKKLPIKNKKLYSFNPKIMKKCHFDNFYVLSCYKVINFGGFLLFLCHK